MRRAVFPGSFDPPTIAHLAIADATLEQCRCDHLTFMLSRAALGKADRDETLLDRAEALRRLVDDRSDIAVELTHARHIAAIAEGFDVVVVGADKWAQILDPQWFDTTDDHEASLTLLPEVALVARPPTMIVRHPRVITTMLSLGDPRLAEVSSTAVRAGRLDWAATRLTSGQ
jgi:Cytidylyltransferase-like